MVFDPEGEIITDDFPSIMRGDKLFQQIDKKPSKEVVNGRVSYVYVASDLNTIPEEIADKYIINPYRVYLYKVNIADNCIELFSRGDMGSFLSRTGMNKLLKHSRVYYSFDNDCNTPYAKFGDPNASMVDNIIIVADHNRYTELSVMIREILNKEKDAMLQQLRIINDMIDAAADKVKFQVEPHDMMYIEGDE